jgi:CheY-like chemotaxis protein
MLGIGADRDLPTVLLIDDDMISREVIATILTLNGYTLHTAEDGAMALKLLDQRDFVPQVILADVRMEGINGTELVRELRKRTRSRIYAISGSALPDDLKSAIDGFLMKPFGPEDLQDLLERSRQTADVSSVLAIEPVISAEILGQFRQMMPEATVRDVYKAVVADLQKHLDGLAGAIAEHDAKEVRRIGHTIKGGCGMAGARQAARLGALLESESDELNNSEAIRIDLQVALQALEAMLKVEFPT